MDQSVPSFKDILEPRRREISNFMWVSRELNTKLAYTQTRRPSPEQHKTEVLYSRKIQDAIEKISKESGVSKKAVEKQVRLILDEIGFNKQLAVIRWLGLALAKMCTAACSGIYVNENGIARLKSTMGNTPVLLVPTHRSYADFILMSYICFTYDIEIPSIAAGMDFHGMWGMGNVLRNTGAFFMRRAINDDKLYWLTFRQYVHQITTKGDLPIEFFIEGTRSRSGKSLMPKYGLLSMLLKPFFTSEVPDVLIVPINISYDKVMEERLFAYELLGIPKPKETTSAFFKSLKLLKEKFGNIYVDVCEPISALEYFKNSSLDRSVHCLKPLAYQELTPNERSLLNDLALDVVHLQQEHATVLAFNIIAVVLCNAILQERYVVTLNDLVKEVSWLKSVFESLGARVAITDVKTSVIDALVVHKNLITVVSESEIHIAAQPETENNIDPSRLKAHALSLQTMKNAIPVMMLQLYVNPCLHYVANLGIVTCIMMNCGGSPIDKGLYCFELLLYTGSIGTELCIDFVYLYTDELFGHFQFLRSLLTHEFVFVRKREHMEYEQALKQLDLLQIIEMSRSGQLSLGNHEKLRKIISNMLLPFFVTYKAVYQTLSKVTTIPCPEKTILAESQKLLENSLTCSTFIHPYILSIDTITNCLQSLIALHILDKRKINDKVMYTANVAELSGIVQKLGNLVRENDISTNFKESYINVFVASKL